MTQEFVTLPREVVEQALLALRIDDLALVRESVVALRAALEQPQAKQPVMTPIAQRKLEDLVASGYTISGYSVYHEQKHQHGFVTGAGLVGWWRPEGVEYPQPLGEQEPVAWLTIEVMGSRTKVDVEWEDQLQKLPSGIYKLYTNPQPRHDASGKPDEWFDRLKATHNIK